jgi:hypothetical protein
VLLVAAFKNPSGPFRERDGQRGQYLIFQAALPSPASAARNMPTSAALLGRAGVSSRPLKPACVAPLNASQVHLAGPLHDVTV